MKLEKNLRDLAEKTKGGDSEAGQLLIIAIDADSPLAGLDPEQIAERLLHDHGEDMGGEDAEPDMAGDGDGDDYAAMLRDAVPAGMNEATFIKAIRAAEAAGIVTCGAEYADVLGDSEE